jgi:hypothetical protein
VTTIRSLNALFALAFAIMALSGCTQSAPPAAAASPSPQVSTMTCFGYTFTFERAGDGPSGVEGHRGSTRAPDGKETDLDEDLTITCGTRTARIRNGKLSIGEKDCGNVRPGDRINCTS